MKKLFLVAVLAVGLTSFAQEKGEKRERLSAEQQTELQVKKMAIDLDLSDKQQKDLKVVFLEKAKKREVKMNEMKANKEKGEKLSKDARFEMKNKMLDEQLAMKAKMKTILNDSQLKKWEELKKNRKGNREDRKDKMFNKRKQ